MRNPPDISTALAAFVTHKANIDTILARLTALSGEHFNCTPDAVTWGDVGTLASYLKVLRQVSDASFHQREHAAG